MLVSCDVIFTCVRDCVTFRCLCEYLCVFMLCSDVAFYNLVVVDLMTSTLRDSTVTPYLVCSVL